MSNEVFTQLGHDVSLVCFEHGGKEFHVFVARREDFPAHPEQIAPALDARTHLVATAWSDLRNHYILWSAMRRWTKYDGCFRRGRCRGR